MIWKHFDGKCNIFLSINLYMFARVNMFTGRCELLYNSILEFFEK